MGEKKKRLFSASFVVVSYADDRLQSIPETVGTEVVEVDARLLPLRTTNLRRAQSHTPGPRAAGKEKGGYWERGEAGLAPT